MIGAGGGGGPGRARKRLAVLAYHKIGPPSPGGWETWYYVPEGQFAEHLEWLRREGWEPIELPRLVAGLADPATMPDRAVLVTFDDGYRTLLDHALPHLVRLGFPAVVFVPTNFIGGTNAFDAETAEPVEPICGWDELRELERWGVAVQPHGASHRPLSGLDRDERAKELELSGNRLRAGLGRPIELFSFPYGDDGGEPEALRPLLRRLGYKGAFLYGGGVIDLPVDDVYRLARLPIGPDTDLRALLDTAG